MENAVLPGGLHITRRSIRGIDSCGMICSLDELGLQSERAEGIFPLETVWDSDLLEKYVGQPFGYLTLSFPCNGDTISYRLNDVVFDLDNKFITNRPDLFSVVGNAREIACIGKTPFSYPPYSIHPREDFFGGLSVSIQSDKVINYFLTKYSFESITETPFVLKVLLKRSNQGLHGILPDITNLVLNELGQPSHVFDADIIVGDIVVRPALSGETLVALDNKTYTLTPEDLVIADSEKILAIAGVI